MRRELKINNFRGIEELNWQIPSDKKLICLIGSGDVGKTTVLEALNWLLGDRWNIPISVCDFNDEKKPISIEAVLDNLPDKLLQIERFGLFLSGVHDDGTMTEDPDDGTGECLIVRLVIDGSMEPVWSATKYGRDEEKLFTVSDRRELGVCKLDDRVDMHSRWSQNSALGKISRESEGAKSAMHLATSAAREALRGTALPDKFRKILNDVKNKSQGYGAARYGEMAPGIDLSSASSYGGIALYSDAIPLMNYGLGTRRLTSLAVQRMSTANKATFLVDEIESGLEPHRIRRLIQILRDDNEVAQVFITTHSNVAVEFCASNDLAVVTDCGASSSIRFVSTDLETLHRRAPSSFLARRILVVEGKTEEGLLKALCVEWDDMRSKQGEPVSAALGSVVCQGSGGDSACVTAGSFLGLGYEVGLLVDSDVPEICTKAEALRELGVDVYRWHDESKIEWALMRELSKTELLSLMSYVIDEDVCSREKVFSDLHACGIDDAVCDMEFESWSNIDVETMRESISAASTRKNQKGKDIGWFKSFSRGELLGEWIIRNRRGDLQDVQMDLLEQEH